MPGLAETQAVFRRAIAGSGGILPPITGGPDPARRLSIHRRHYGASLASHLLGRFPATVWLVGSEFAAAAAGDFIRRHPPRAPCLAEYGSEFPAFLAAWPGAGRLPYLQSIAEADWHLGFVAVAVDREALAIGRLAGVEPTRLPDLRLTLQPGLAYLSSSWPVDELIRLHLAETAPDRFELTAAEVFIEIRGARGAFGFSRLEPPAFAFRSALAEGAVIGTAVERAAATDAGFDPAAALARLFGDGLVVAFRLPG